MSAVVKMTVNLTEEAAKMLKDMADRQNTTMTNIVNKAIILEDFMTREAVNNQIQLLQGDKVKTIILR